MTFLRAGKRRHATGVALGGMRPGVLPGLAMVLGGAVSIQLGGALAVLLFAVMSPLAVASLRLVVAAAILMAVCRPRFRGLRRADWALLTSFGVSLATMQALMYLALQRIPLGAAVTLDVLGPLVLSVLTSRRPISLLWAALAGTGVFLLGNGGMSALDPVGVVLALLAGAVWAVYIMLSARSARRFPKADGVAIAMTIAAVVGLPLGLATAGGALRNPGTVAAVAGLAVVSTAVPYALDTLALGKLSESMFGVLMSLDPAIAATAGLVILGQRLSPAELLALGLVMAASVGGVMTPPRARTALSADLP
jgi:inner membrane transporter RhtA